MVTSISNTFTTAPPNVTILEVTRTKFEGLGDISNVSSISFDVSTSTISELPSTPVTGLTFPTTTSNGPS